MISRFVSREKYLDESCHPYYVLCCVVVSGQLRTAVGQGELLMRQRFTQFSGLVDACEAGGGERATLCSDLEGFWEMIYFQVTTFATSSAPPRVELPLRFVPLSNVIDRRRSMNQSINVECFLAKIKVVL